MKVTIFGTGYVGLVTGTCLADMGHQVMCVDVDEKKIHGLRNGVIPIYEPGLESLVKSNVANGQLLFTTDAAEGVAHADIQFIAVGTPPDEDGMMMTAGMGMMMTITVTVAAPFSIQLTHILPEQ